MSTKTQPNTYATYAYCSNCGSEYFDDDIKRVPFVGTYPNGKFGKCLDCGKDMLLEFDDEPQGC